MSWIEHFRSANWNHASGIFLCAYILGCFASGYYLVRWLTGRDIREIGSGSVGARNVGRILGKTGFLSTVAFDLTKGILAVWAARQFTADDRLVVIAMIGVVIGHVWPVQLRFHGGKGMATSLGSLLVFDAQLAVAFAALFLALFACLRRTVLPGLFALACVPLASLLLDQAPARVILLSVWAGLVLLAHRKNLMDEFSLFAERREHAVEPDQPPL
ncbi:MAG TPA: glycerol-3-phosphate acyltransferase [Verrucomicrobia bacterium]|nr:glycerol-3-phosphate acyltransferase [Verrucomicrobiota bacterium]HOP98684.1 glycerol-3-phosphate acyltransferase [Verrucomicrobiota bacterium]HPU57582.1 glycerol-3-phosphate acyltransferase [Verrucomicrobiota bacterium]